MIRHEAVELKSGSVTLIVPITAPGGLFSGKVIGEIVMLVGASLTSKGKQRNYQTKRRMNEKENVTNVRTSKYFM